MPHVELDDDVSDDVDMSPRVPHLLEEFPVHKIEPKPGSMSDQPIAAAGLHNYDNYIGELMSAFSRRLSPDYLQAVRDYLTGADLSLASFCSGTECPRLGLEASESLMCVTCFVDGLCPIV
jgi:hypothetical protein